MHTQWLVQMAISDTVVADAPALSARLDWDGQVWVVSTPCALIAPTANHLFSFVASGM